MGKRAMPACSVAPRYALLGSLRLSCRLARHHNDALSHFIVAFLRRLIPRRTVSSDASSRTGTSQHATHRQAEYAVRWLAA
jgi:hypothetical protein